ncbi:MAG: hypothetical protein JOZ74_00435 [Bradyrhizobium sp.]|nr:hypothetical protein [Bradyrhizobium sp.]
MLEAEGAAAAFASGLIVSPMVLAASALASVVGCGAPPVAAELAVAEASVAAVVPLDAVVAGLPWVTWVVLNPVAFVAPVVVPGVPAAVASAVSAAVAAPVGTICGAAAVPAVGA